MLGLTFCKGLFSWSRGISFSLIICLKPGVWKAWSYSTGYVHFCYCDIVASKVSIFRRLSVGFEGHWRTREHSRSQRLYRCTLLQNVVFRDYHQIIKSQNCFACLFVSLIQRVPYRLISIGLIGISIRTRTGRPAT